MGIVLLADEAVRFMLIVLLVPVVGLTWWELKERDFEPKVTRWWLALVILTHAVGYLILRGYGAFRDRPQKQENRS